MKFNKRFAILPVVCGISLNALGQQNQVKPDVEEVYVSASRSQAKLESMPVHTTLITQEDIQKSPATTLDQLLRNVPGVNLSGAPYYVSDPTGTSLKMRGLANAKVLVMVDGIPVHDPFYSTIQWFKMPLASIESVEVIRGGGSALWGNLAVAGVINVITKKPEGDGGEVSIAGGNMNTLNGSVSKNISISDQFKIRLSADYFNTDGYIPSPTFLNGKYNLIAGQQANSMNQKNFRVDSNWRYSGDTNVFFKMGYNEQTQFINNEIGLNLQSSFDFSTGFNSQLNKNQTLDGRLWYQSTVFGKNNSNACYGGISASVAGAPVTSSSACTAATKFNNDLTGLYPIYRYLSQTDSQTYSELGSSIVFNNYFENSSYSTGFDTRRITANDIQVGYTAPTTIIGATSPSVNTNTYAQATQQFLGVFYQQKYRPFDPLELTLTGRYDYWNNSNAGLNITTPTSNTVSGPGWQPEKTQSSFDPSFSLKYFATDDWSFRGSAYKGFRAPGLNNMYRSYGANTTSASFSNPDLNPETLYGWELGSDYHNQFVDLSATYYSLYVQNMNYSMKLTNTSSGVAGDLYNNVISTYHLDPTKNTSFGYYYDQFDSRSNGIELASKFKILPNFSMDAKYMFTNAYLTSTIDPASNPSFSQLGGVSPSVGILGFDWIITPKLKTYWQARAVAQTWLDTAHTVVMPGYITADFSIAYEVDKSTTLTTSVVNLLNQGYYTDGGSSSTSPTLGIPRFIMVGAKFKY